MIRRLLRLCVGLALAACLANIPAPPASFAPMAAVAEPACAFDKITMLPSNFDPTRARGTPVGAGPIPQNIQDDLTAAYKLAPTFFQKQLCGLDGVFITRGADSWGFRNISDGKRYLAVSQALWKDGAAPKYGEYQTSVIHRLLHGWAGPVHSQKPDAAEDGSAVTVLAALAHEFGHILFYDTFVNPRGSAPK
jgi:hypothetical protein